MSKGRIQLLVNATVCDVRCHMQCAHLQKIERDDVYCCMVFGELLGRTINESLLRHPKCIAAERRLIKLVMATP